MTQPELQALNQGTRIEARIDASSSATQYQDRVAQAVVSLLNRRIPCTKATQTFSFHHVGAARLISLQPPIFAFSCRLCFFSKCRRQPKPRGTTRFLGNQRVTSLLERRVLSPNPMSSVSEQSDALPQNAPAIERALRQVVLTARKNGTIETLTINIARTAAEQKLGLAAGFLKSHSQWKDRSKDVVKAALVRLIAMLRSEPHPLTRPPVGARTRGRRRG